MEVSAPPTWEGLLRGLSDVAGLVDQEKGELEGLISAGALLEAAEFVHSTAESRARLSDVHTKLKLLTDGPVNSNYKPNKWHDALMMLEPRVIITTNYDKLIERASQSGYNVHTYSSTTVGHEIRRGDPVLLKIHGSVDDPQNVVLSQSDYTRLHISGRHALQIVQSLFLTRVTLFVGYSISDPDMRLMLQNAMGSFAQASSHYILTEEVGSYKRKFLQNAFGVAPVEFPAGEYEVGLEMLRSLGNIPPDEE